jgi:hypothetical protein
MTRLPPLLLFAPLLCLPLAGCYADQKQQLASCEAAAPRTGENQPFTAIRACMDKAGYRWIAWDYASGTEVECDMGAVIKGQPSATGTDAVCFEPKGWLALKIYRIEVPVKTVS